jgi:gas vesicle protein
MLNTVLSSLLARSKGYLRGSTTLPLRGTAMKIEDLYLELGRAMTEKITVGQDSKVKQDLLQEQVQTLNRELQSERDRIRNRQDRIQQHVDELQEAIRLAAEGVDPTLAKLTAKESLEDRRLAEKTVQKVVGVNGGCGGVALNNPYGYYGATIPVGPTTVAGGGMPAGNAVGQWHTYTIPTYDGTGYTGTTPTP